jgi:hypothetical protein
MGTIAVCDTVHEKVRLYAESKNRDIKDVTDELLMLGLDKLLSAEKLYSQIEYQSTRLNEMAMYDNKVEHYITVRRHEGRLYCDFHKNGVCEHTEFARVRGELGKMYGEDSDFR